MKIEVVVVVPEGKLCYFVGATSKDEISCMMLGDVGGTLCPIFKKELDYSERSGEGEYAGEVEMIFKCQECLDSKVVG